MIKWRIYPCEQNTCLHSWEGLYFPQLAIARRTLFQEKNMHLVEANNPLEAKM